ncbi:hypothetical protein L798_00169 [Zootermopsis nevadensis]|uniref:Ionotropic glutamate receptor C-terminal domain-containing protein n=1 Tax=Zootermopsis nevadensis TaxID=136037 RepID=A0A067RGE5_ZOONE|nr:hypothetical protein L798_00169 [Zootermopsis nevadensis]
MIMLQILTLASLGMLQVAGLLRDDGVLSVKQRHMVVCVVTIAKGHFSPGQSTLVSFPNAGQGISRRTLAQYRTNTEMHMLCHTLQNMHEQMLWLIGTSSLYVSLNTGYETYWKIDHYIIFTWSGEEQDSVTDAVIDQVQKLKDSSWWNNKAEFLVVVTEYHTKNDSQLALEILRILWTSYRILNVIVLIPQTINLQPMMDTHDGNIKTSTFDLHTWFPYQSEIECADVRNTIVIDRWILEGEGRFLKEVPLFPAKIHKNFHGCPLKISAIDVQPLVVKDNYIDEDNKMRPVYSGLEVECCRSITTALNMTPVFVPVTTAGLQARVDLISDLEDGSTDVAFGAFPLHELIYSLVDSTISYIDDYMSWYVPCGKPVPRMEKITKMFTVSVWLMIGLVFVLSVVMTWLIAKRAQNCAVNESSGYATVSDSVQNLWAVTLGLAVRELPRTGKLRSYFCLFVWYCFSVSIVFQTYFTSVLVNPGVKERITTLEELYSSDLVYHYIEENDDYLKYSLQSYYSEIKLRRTECGETEYCLYDLLRSQTFAVIEHSFHIEYVTSIIKNPELCSLDVAIYRLSFAMHLAEGSHLVDTFNDIIYKIIQAGLIVKWWNDLKTKYQLSAYDHYSMSPNYADFNDDDKDYFVFSLSHLQVAFYVIGVGGIIGFLALMGEILHDKFFKKP